MPQDVAWISREFAERPDLEQVWRQFHATGEICVEGSIREILAGIHFAEELVRVDDRCLSSESYKGIARCSVKVMRYVTSLPEDILMAAG